MSTASPSITLIVPGLFPVVDDTLRLPALETLLARGQAVQTGSVGLEPLLFARFGHRAGAGEALPVGAVRARGDGLPADGRWRCCCDPVHLVADRDRLLLAAWGESLALSREEAQALAAELRPLLEEDGLQLEVASGGRWYLSAETAPAITTRNPNDWLGREVGAALPGGADSGQWRSRLTELQMLLHASGVNRQREAQGRPTINSVWFWGTGHEPRLPDCPWRSVLSDSPLVRGLAQLACGDGVARSPQAPEAFDGDTLVVLPPPEATAWSQVMRAYERQWFAPLLSQLRRGALQSIRIETERGVGRHCTRRSLRRLWRRRRSLAGFAP